MTSLVDAPPPRMIEGEERLVKGERGDLRRTEGEGGGGRKERAAGGERGRAALGRAALWGTEGSRARGGERSGAGRGEFFSSLIVGPRITNPIRTSPPG